MSTPIPPAFNMAAYVLAQAATQPDKPALIVAGDAPQEWSYAQLAHAVGGTATGLLSHGLQPGDRVLMRLANTPDFPIVYLAAIMAGLIPIPTSAQLTTPEVTAIASDTTPGLVVCADGVALPDQDIPRLPQSALAAMRDLPDAAPVMGDPDRPAYIVYTSGTSGQPRAVVHAHRAVWARRMMWEGWYGLRPTDRLLHAGAFNWTYTLGTGLMDPWAIGATAIIPTDGTDASALPALLARHEATIFAAAPGVYRRLLRTPLPKLPHLRHGLSAGEKLPHATRTAWEDATGTPVHEAFGMSECSTFLSGSPAKPAPTDTLGYPQPGRRVAILGTDGPVDTGTHGVIAVHRDDPGLMLGYLDRPEETATRFQGDWFLTGDMGHTTPEGAVVYDGRADDMMNAGGYRVSPLEVEAALYDAPGLTEAACAEVRVKADTTVIAAFYTAPNVLDDEVLRQHVTARLAAYKVPRLFVHVATLPRGANNKLLRKSLRIQWEAEHGQT